jgi:hypothetical protein
LIASGTFVGALGHRPRSCADDLGVLNMRDIPADNRLPGALPAEVQQRLLPVLERVDLPLGKVLYESGGQLRHT